MPEGQQPLFTDSRYGHDLNAVSDVNCLSCGKTIGNEPHLLDTTLARYGQMLLWHRRCVEESEASVDEFTEPEDGGE